MEYTQSTQANSVSTENGTSRTFVFSKPNVLNPPKVINSVVNSNQVSDNFKQNIFTFAMPVAVSQPSNQDTSYFQSSIGEKQYKPRITRNSYKPAVNVFAQALKDTAMFEQLKKNSRSQNTKINSENSITCTYVPHSLLTKTSAKQHFTQFGSILKITIRPKKQIITVTYTTKEEANVAYNKCGEYSGEKFNIEWTKSATTPKLPTKKKDLQKNIVSQMVSNFFKSPDDDVKFELDGMMNLEYNLHNRDNIDESLRKKSKALQSKTVSKSSRAEKSMKSDKHKSDSQISDLLPNATIEELQSIIQQPAYTSEDKYKVLEARDRLMRMKQTKSLTLAAARVMIGTCPDMCPEKERLMREAKRQVALYELLESSEYKINHSRAVKQYSRSSADQEEPMAHELRPVKSLKMTMSYLLHEIANLCDQQGTNLGEWYHFLWDRTRGIRKDITQQELCCVDSVELVEQCARFHIVCSERLCAEEASVFDKRINSDNLTKCLQSLKYMYHDLRVKGISCKNEPEFRAYIILLNLNNGNFMWDLQRLPKYIQKSPEVRFALEIYIALDSSNYYKFFDLVKKTTYLNACILLRYFNQVRLKALAVLVKAYCRTASTEYPLYELIDILGFENENEAIYFCEQVGLNISNDGLYVLLNRRNFTMPVLNIKQDRACNLIESKRTLQQLSIGECMAGGKMPEKSYRYHKPHNSFDSLGYLMPESINAEDQGKNLTLMTDPYEFEDEDAVTTKQLISTSKKDQSNIESTSTDYANIFQSPASTEPDKNMFTTVQSGNDISVSSKHQAQTNKVQAKPSKPENQNELNIFNLKSKQQDFPLNESKAKESSVSLNTFNTTSADLKTSKVFSKQFVSLANNDTSAFAQATNKSIFSGTTQGNIFMKNLTPSTILSNSFSNVQTIPKSSCETNLKVDITKNTSKDVQNFFVPVVKIQEKTSQEKEAEKLKLKEEERIKKMQQINETAELALNSLQTLVVNTYCSDIVKEEMDKINVYSTLSEDISSQVQNEIIHEMCDSIVKEEIINTQRVHEMSIKMKNRAIIKYFNIWKSNALKKKQQRRALEDTPVWLQKYSSQQCAKLLYSKEQDLVIQSMCKKEDKAKKTVKSYSESLASIETIIYSGIKENLKSCDINVHSNYYWKLVISWPDLHNKPILWHHKNIMNQYINPSDYTIDPIIKLYHPQSNQIETLHICIRHFEGLISDYNLIGSDALLFIAAASEDVKFVIRRLTKTVLSRDRLMPIPLVFAVLGDSNFESQNTEVIFNLEKLLKSGYLSVYTIIHEKDLTEETILNLTSSAMLWLSINKSPRNPLEMDYLQNIYDTCLTEELWLRIFDDTFLNKKLSRALTEPNFIIDLHNEAVTHITDISLDPESFMYTKFAPEFKKFIKNQYTVPCSYEYFDDTWKSEEYKAELEKVMSSFKLPQWKYGWPINDSNILCQNIISYCQEALCSNELSLDVLNNLLFTSGMSVMINFIDILLCIIKKKVYLLEKDFKIVYNKNYMKRFRTLPWWLKSKLLIEYKFALAELSVENNERKNTKKEKDSDEPIVKKRKLYKNDTECEPLATFCEDSRSQIMEVHCTSKKIENRLKTHQQQSLLFEERLKNALLSENQPI
ncbi:RRM_XMAS2 and SAC3_GANP domain-containing protein xmas [Osmia lignaria lignaria]|uniref:RRM_XMAS2 and SAC3_GANP domain-containing protein xmas n=1 Tax=Osmia lignaria lignaria TaxID=1437193 RepID=UPI00402B4139